MSEEQDSTPEAGTDDSPSSSLDPRGWSRRQLLIALGAGTASAGGAAAGGRYLTDPDDADTTAIEDEQARALAERFAPDIYFDAYEKWFITDPRAYETTVDGETIVDGFTALNEYSREMDEREDPPRPVVFYNAVRYEDSPLAVIQFWMYEAFDQFTTNFHWHDFEVLHVFVDVETDEAQLYVASSHGRNIPNNEYLDPEEKPSIIPELGAHASALAVNETRDRFQRFPDDDLGADITNRPFEEIEDLAEVPVAYGLPRDEGLSLPFAIPTLEDEPLYEHEQLPDVDREDFIAPELTARSYTELVSPPEDLPLRETGLHYTPAVDPDAEADYEYPLESSKEVEHIEAFTGPLLRFEFEVPDFAEDAISGHLSTIGVPWEQPRYDNPAKDITDPIHRRELANRYDAIDYGGPTSMVAGALQDAIEDEDAPDGNGVTTEPTDTLSFCLLESDPTAVPSWSRAAAVREVEPGEHRLTVNTPGKAPYSERVTADPEATTALGADGEVTLVERGDAVKIDGDATEGPDIERLAIEDDFGGRLFDFQPDTTNQFAAYVHRGGAYTVELRDTDDEPGAYRVNPEDQSRRTIDNPQTGKESLASFLADITTETAEQAPDFADSDTDDKGDADGDDDDSAPDDEDDHMPDDGGVPDDPLADLEDIDISGVEGLQRALVAVADSAEHAAERAAEGQGPEADRALEAVAERLGRVEDAIDRNDFDVTLEVAVDKRLEQARKRAEQALETQKSN